MRTQHSIYRCGVLLALGSTILWSSAGCGSGGAQDVSQPLVLPSQVRSALDANTPVSQAHVTAYNRFGFDALQELRKKDAAKNIVLSPFSLALALQIVYNGARNETQIAMAKTLHVEDVVASELNARNAALQASLVRQDATTTLTIANGLWLRDNLIHPAFVQVNTDYYGSNVGDMKDVPDGVNTWVNTHTNGKIPTLLPTDADYSDTWFVVVNAVYFKSAWTAPFDPAATQNSSFATPAGDKQVRMMVQQQTLPMLHREGFTGIKLPFGKQKKLAFVVLLPDRVSSLSALLTQVTPENWATWRTLFQPTTAIIGLPRLKTAYRADMIPPLKTLGMEIAFDDTRANFSGLVNESAIGLGNLYLQFVLHQATLELTEEGAEASAGTGVGGGATSAPPSVFVDRPFLFAIEDAQTGVLLFLGAIVDPTQT